MGNIWFTSDTHFGQRNICLGLSSWEDKSTCRPFNTIEEHDAYLLNELNKRVKPSDVLYHLGDVGFGYAWKDRFKQLREAIKCEIVYLVLGNHDHVFENEDNVEPRSLFKWVRPLYYGRIASRKFTLCHYAMRTWPWAHKGGIHLHGHSHGNLPDDPNARSLDVGVDTCLFGHEKFTPYSAEELFAIMDQHKIFVPVDHHR